MMGANQITVELHTKWSMYRHFRLWLVKKKFQKTFPSDKIVYKWLDSYD
mgnify:CR=1 FL=1